MTENLIQLPKTGSVKNEFAQEEDRKKAYQIFFFSAIGSVILTILMYLVLVLI